MTTFNLDVYNVNQFRGIHHLLRTKTSMNSTLAEIDNLESSNNPEFFLHGKPETLMLRVNKKCNMEWRSRLLCY